jgi:hypothetical protein
MNNNIYRGQALMSGYGVQRGYGLGNTFKRFMRWVVPLYKRYAQPKLESGLRELGRTAVSTASNIANDAISGRNVKEAAEEHINTAVDSIKDKVEKTLEGKGIKRKKKFKKFVVLKKKSKFKDIFD